MGIRTCLGRPETMKDALFGAWFCNRVAHSAEDPESQLAAKNFQGYIGRVALSSQSPASAVNAVKLESIRSINLAPSATPAVWLATR